MRKLLYDHQILSPKAWKRTHRKLTAELREKKANAGSRREQKALQEAILTAEEAHPARERCSYADEMIQMEAFLHKWFGDRKTQLHAAIDGTTVMVAGAYFDERKH